VPLSPLVLAELSSLPRRGPFVFTTHRAGENAISCFSDVKQMLDCEMPADVEPWTLHDLRRTAASGMGGLGVAPHVIEAVLNHRSGVISGIARVYNRNPYGPEKRAALVAWADRVAQIVGAGAGEIVLPQPSNVVAMR
jgi:integrase